MTITSPPRADLRLAGEQLAHQALGEFGGLEAIGVGAGQAEDDRRPGRRAAEHAREPRRAGAPRAGERQPDDERDGEGGAGEAGVVEPQQRRPLRDGEEGDQRGAEKRERNGEDHARTRLSLSAGGDARRSSRLI